MRVYIHGAGNAGSALARGLRRAGWPVMLRAARRGLPKRINADLVVVAVRDSQVRALAESMAQAQVVPPRAVVVHLAGALGPEELAAVRDHCRGVAQMHPMLAFADRRKSPTMFGGHMQVQGDREAERVARAVARALGMVPRSMPGLDRAAYHAAGGIVAAGAIGLAQAAMQVLVGAGVAPKHVGRMLGPLLRSVGENLGRLGVAAALTGPVRRGDSERVAAHLRAVGRVAPGLMALVCESIRAQIPLARALGEAQAGGLPRIEALVDQRRGA